MEPPVIIRLQLDHVRHEMSVAISKHQAEISALVESALTECLQPEAVMAAVREQVERELRRSIDEAVHRALESSISYELGRIVAAAAEHAAHESLQAMRERRR